MIIKERTITAPKVNIELKNGTILNDVHIFTDKNLGDSIVKSTFEIADVLAGLPSELGDKIIYFGGDFIQGGISSHMQIKNWNLVD